MLLHVITLTKASEIMEKLKDEVRTHQDSKFITAAAKLGKTATPVVYLSFNGVTLKLIQEDTNRGLKDY